MAHQPLSSLTSVEVLCHYHHHHWTLESPGLSKNFTQNTSVPYSYDSNRSKIFFHFNHVQYVQIAYISCVINQYFPTYNKKYFVFLHICLIILKCGKLTFEPSCIIRIWIFSKFVFHSLLK